MPPNAPRVPGSSECAASLPEAPECVASPASDNCPGSLRTRHLSPTTPAGRLTPDAPEPAACPAWPSPESPSRELSEWAEPREPPHRVITPEHSASVPRVPRSDLFFSRIKIHRKAMQL